jgi:hypothetical protein
VEKDAVSWDVMGWDWYYLLFFRPGLIAAGSTPSATQAPGADLA